MGVDELAVKVAEIEERMKTNTFRIDKIEVRQDNLDRLMATVEVLANQQKNLETDVKEIKSDVKALTEKPAKRWDLIITGIITAIIGAVMGIVIPHLFH